MPLIVVLIVVGFLGTLAGARIVMRMDVKTFQRVFRIMMTIMAAEMFRRGVTGLL
jgi:uncharacterized protein